MTERLGLGPDDVMARNPRIVYGRLTGWGQQGPLAPTAGHSLNYEAITGVIRAIGPAGGPPVPLLQIIGDFAGGGLLMAYGVVCALLEAQRSGQRTSRRRGDGRRHHVAAGAVLRHGRSRGSTPTR